MKNKLIAVFILAIFIFSSLSFIGSQENLEELAKDAEKIEEGVEKIEEGAEKYGKWDYLGPEIQRLVMENKQINYVFNEQDGLLSKIDIVFVVLFGEHYKFSLGFLIVIILWFWFFAQLSGILKDFSMFSSGTSIILGLGLTIVFAQTSLFSLIVQGLGWLVVSPDAWWVRTLIFIGIVAFFTLFAKIRFELGKIEKQMKEQEAKTLEKIDRNFLHMTAEAVRNGLGIGVGKE
jgi:hypothetical protein